MSKVLMFVLVLFIATWSGCTSNKVTCLHDHKIVTAKTDSTSVRMLYVDIKHEEGVLIVTGAVKKQGLLSQAVATHIDVSVLDEQGKLLRQAKSDEIYVPRHRIGGGPDFIRFKVSVPMDVQQNITVCAEPHGDRECGIEKS